MPKIIALDIETRPTTAYVWGLRQENIGIEQIVEPGGMLCIALEDVTTGERWFYSEWEHGMVGMLQGVYNILIDADAVVTFNGDRFDLPKINGQLLRQNLPPLPPLTSIDVFKSIRKLGFVSNRLGFVAPLLTGLGKKDTGGFKLWKDVMDGKPKAQQKMQKYCIKDVTVLVALYKRVLPFIRNHPFVADRTACPSCGGVHVHSRGFRRTRTFKIQRLQCQDCGGWHDGKREKAG